MPICARGATPDRPVVCGWSLPGGAVLVHAIADSFAEIASLELFVGGQEVALDANGRWTALRDLLFFDGQANYNDAVIDLLATTFGVRTSAVEIVRGASARRKLVRIRGDVGRLTSLLHKSGASTR